METKSILKFRRNGETWLCPGCDVENNITSDFCNVCGCPKSSATVFFDSYSESEETDVTPVMPESDAGSPGSFSPIFGDREDIAEETSSGKKSTVLKILLVVLILAVIAIIAVVSIFAIKKHNKQEKYEEAISEFNNGNYEEAIRLFEELPSDYKDVENMILESTYQSAVQLMYNSEYERARTVFSELGDFKDSADMINECTYLEACDYLQYGEYEKAKEMFQELYDYGNSEEMVTECDYCIAQNFLDDGEYVAAMKAFYDLGSYRSSSDKFYSAESMLTDENYYTGYFVNEYTTLGKWADDHGRSIEYYIDEEGDRRAKFIGMGKTSGTYYKLTNGIHYLGNNVDGWTKQFIIQRIDDSTIHIYNYIDNSAYYLYS